MYNFYLKKVFIVLLLLFFIIFNILSQTSYEEWRKNQEKKYTDFSMNEKKRFKSFLNDEWQRFELFKNEIPDNTPKPTTIPVSNNEESPIFGKSVSVGELPDLKRDENIVKKIEEINIDVKDINIDFDFYNTRIKIGFDGSLQSSLNNKISNKTIANFWENLYDSDYESLLGYLRKLKEILYLNDWGYILLNYKVGSEIFNSESERVLFVWFMFLLEGYDVKVGYSNTDVYLLLPTNNQLYSTPFFSLNNKRYYLVALNSKTRTSNSIYTYNSNFKGSDKILNFNIESIPLIGSIIANKELVFYHNKKKHLFDVKYNQGLVEFFRDYPHSDIEIYFSAPISNNAFNSILEGLKTIIDGTSEVEACNIILHFVQTAFEYKTDQQQFGKEKWLFGEETIYYPASDCEDRSILFSFLVKNILGLDVVGLDYPGHIATAVKFSDDVSGDYIMHKSEKYIICDPTYINADIGMEMPLVKGNTPKIVSFK